MRTFTWKVILLFAALWSGRQLYAQDTATYSRLSPGQLFERSLATFSTPEKVIIRSYIRRHFPQTPEGMASKAFIQGYEDEFDTSKPLQVKYYKECIKKYPNFLFAPYSLMRLVDQKQEIQYGELIYKINPAYNNYAVLKRLADIYINEIKDSVTTRNLLQKWRAELGGIYVIDYLEGIYQLQFRGDNEKALEYFRKAIAAKPDDFQVYQWYGDLMVSKLREDTSLNEEKIKDSLLALDKYIESTGTQEVRSQVALYYGRLFANSVWQSAEFNYLSRSFDLHPTADAVAAVLPIDSLDRSKKIEFARKATVILPGNATLFRALALHYMETELDRKEASRYFDSAVRYSCTQRDTIDNITTWGRDLLREIAFEYDKELALYQPLLNTWTGKNRETIALEAYGNRRMAGDYKSALEYLNSCESFLRDTTNNININFFISKKRELQDYMKNEEKIAEFYYKNPFLNYWQEEFGQGLTARVNFAKDSAALTNASKNYLRRIGRLVKEKGAESYQFSIEGHCDDKESPEIARTRAEEVKTFLYEEVGIPKSKMNIVSLANNLPLVPNNDELTSSRNRRVEVIPYGNLEEPNMLVTSAFNVQNEFSLSPDGKLMAIGYNPIQLWDVTKGGIVRNLGRGNQRKFSPNGRFLAAISNFTDIGQIKVCAIYIYDVKTGLIVNIIPEDDEIHEFDWSPFNDRVVYCTAPGYMKIFDLKENKLVRSVQLSDLKISGKLLWTRAGNYIISGQAQAEVLKIWDANTLTPLKTLTGVDWPHSLCETSSHYLVCCDNTRKLTVWDMSNWTMKQMTIHVLANQAIPFPADSNMVLLNDFGGIHQNKVLLVNVKDTLIVLQDSVSSEYPLYAFSPDGSKIYKSEEDRVDILNSKNLAKISEVSGMSPAAYTCEADMFNKLFISADRSGIHVWNILNGQKVHDWEGKTDFLEKLPEGEDKFICASVDNSSRTTTVRSLNSSLMTDSSFEKFNFDLDAIAADSGYLGFAIKDFVEPERTPDSLMILVYKNTNPGKPSFPPIVIKQMTLRQLAYGGLNGAGIETFDFSIKRKIAAVITNWHDGFGHDKTVARDIRFFDLNTGKELRKMLISLRTWVGKIRFSDENDSILEVTTVGGIFNLNFLSRKIVRTSTVKLNEKILRVDDATKLIVTPSYIRKLYNGKDVALNYVDYDNLVGAEVFPEENLLITISASNEISFYRLDSLIKCLTINPKLNNEWITYNPQGYFVSSIKGAEKVYWSLGDQLLEFSSLANKFKKPNLIIESLSRVRNRDALNPTTPMSKAYFQPYEFKLSPETNIAKTNSVNYRMIMNVAKPNKDAPRPNLTVRWKGADQPFSLTVVDSVNYTLLCDMVLTDAESNNIQVLVDNKIVGKDFNIYCSTSDVPERTLYFVGIGVAAYPEPYKLSFAKKDIRDVGMLLKQQEKINYNKVVIDTLFDVEASWDNIESLIDSLVNRTVQSTDVLVIYISGHGVQYQRDLYLMTTGADWDHPLRAGTTDVCTLWNKYLSVRRNQGISQTFLWLDMCSAGTIASVAIDPGRLNFSIGGNNTLSAFAACPAGREAKESNKYGNGGNGAFTAAIVEGLSGRADEKPTPDGCSNGDGDKHVSVKELYDYVTKRVPKMTNKQMPEIGFLSGQMDFKIVSCCQ